MLVRGKKGAYLSWNSSLENWRLKCIRFRLLCKERILTPAGGFACSYGSVWGFPPLRDARVRIGNIPSLQCYCHHPIDNVSIRRRRTFSWTPDTHTTPTRVEGVEGREGNGRSERTTQQVLDSLPDVSGIVKWETTKFEGRKNRHGEWSIKTYCSKETWLVQVTWELCTFGRTVL